MFRIMLRCLAGMSTSLLVRKMVEEVESRGLSVKIGAYGVSEFDIQFPNYQVALLGPQVKYVLNTPSERAVTQGIPVKVIDIMDYGTQHGNKMLDYALSLIETTRQKGVIMSSLYQSMAAVIEQSITSLAGKLGQQKYVIAIRDDFTVALPSMIIGSFMLVFIFPPFPADTTSSFVQGWLDFLAIYHEQLVLPFNLSTGVMTFFISVGIGTSLGRQFGLGPVMSSLLAFMAFLLAAAPYADSKISMQYLSGQGIFTTLITVIYSTRIYAWPRQNNVTIRLPREVPTGVTRSFEILILVLVVTVTLHPLNLFTEAQTGMIIPQAIMHLLEPLVSASDSLPVILLSVLLCQVFWFAGIYGSLIVTGTMNLFWMANLPVNQAALAAGATPPYVYLQGLWDYYLLIGGVGSTLPLAFLLLRSCATHLRTIGKMGTVPNFFNINEPILSGVPIIMSPTLFIPFVCVLLVNVVLAYSATKLGWLAQVASLMPWTTPVPIGVSWVANQALSPVVMCFTCIVMSALMHLPSLRAYERSLLKTEE